MMAKIQQSMPDVKYLREKLYLLAIAKEATFISDMINNRIHVGLLIIHLYDY